MNTNSFPTLVASGEHTPVRTYTLCNVRVRLNTDVVSVMILTGTARDLWHGRSVRSIAARAPCTEIVSRLSQSSRHCHTPSSVLVTWLMNTNRHQQVRSCPLDVPILEFLGLKQTMGMVFRLTRHHIRATVFRRLSRNILHVPRFEGYSHPFRSCSRDCRNSGPNRCGGTDVRVMVPCRCTTLVNLSIRPLHLRLDY